jgi:hypothetical protein
VDLAPYLREMRRFLLIALAAAVVVGVATALWVAVAFSGHHRVTLGLILPTITGQPREVEQVTSDFVERIHAPEVVTAAAEASGLQEDVVRNALTADKTSPVGAEVVVEGTGTEPDQLAEAVVGAAVADYRSILQPRLTAARSVEDQLRSQYEGIHEKAVPATAADRRARVQQEAAALREVTDAHTRVLAIETTVETVEKAALDDAVTVAPLKPAWPIVQAGLTNAGGTLFALVGLLVSVELWRSRSKKSASPAAEPVDADPSASAPESPAAGDDEVADGVDQEHQDDSAAPKAPGQRTSKSPQLAATTSPTD